MLSRKLSFRFALAIIALIAITTVTASANWSDNWNVLEYLGITQATPETKPESTTAPEPAPMFLTTVTTNGGSGLAPSYIDLAAAITALNAIPGGVATSATTITVTGTETAPIAGYSITATGTASFPITINGQGTTTITAFTPQATGVRTDAIIKIVGGDYITITGFALQENASNTTTAAASNNMTEVGIGLWLSAVGNGAQNNTIQNNVITLGSTYQNAIGIFSSSSSSSTNSVLAATSTAGTNSNNKFYSNTISSVAYGMYFICEPITGTIFESGNDIGGTGASTANTITFGNATISDNTWTRFSTTSPAGINFRNGGFGDNIRFNSITSNNLSYSAQSSGVYGVYMLGGGTVPTAGTYTSTISDNTINLTNSGTTAITGIDFGGGLATGTMAGSSNIITLNQTAIVSASGAVIGIKGNYASAAATASSNTINFNQTFTPTTSLQTNSSAFTGVTISGTSTTLNANSNIINVNQLVNPGTTITAATLSGQMTGVTAAGAANTVNTNLNQVTVGQTSQPGGSTATALITSTVLGINSAIAGNAGAAYSANYNTVTVNQAANNVASGAATSAITGQFNGIQVGGNNAAGGATNVLGNTVLLNRSVTQSAGQTTTLGNSSTAFIGISATTATTTLTVGSSTTTADQNIVQVRDGTSANGTVTYNAGTVTMMSLGSSTATTASPASVANVLGNKMNTGSTLATTTGSTIRSTGQFSGITIPNQGSLNTVSGNQIIVDRVASGGSVFGYNQSTSPSGLADTITGNTITFTGLTGSAAPTGISALGGIGGASTSKTITGNTINISGTHTGTSTGFAENFSSGSFSSNSITINSASPTVIGVNFNGSSGGSWTSNANTLSLNSSTTSPTSMIGVNGAAVGPFTVTNNIFSGMNFTGVVTGSPLISGVVIAVGAGNAVSGNTVTNISVGAVGSSATPTVDGILISGGTGVNVFKNKVYGLTTQATGNSTVLSGIRISGGGVTNPNNIYNNLIGKFLAPASTSTTAERGINITSTALTSTNNVYYNTVYLDGSGASGFGGAALFHAGSSTATTATLNLRNNILVNLMTPSGVGAAAAYQRNGAAGTLANYASSSNNNLFYTGSSPSVTNPIYLDQASAVATLSAYKTGVPTTGTIAPRDAASITEDPEFPDTTGSSANFLKYKITSAKQIESGAVNIVLSPITITDDYFGTIRQGNGGYAGTGTAPDIGAWELAGIAADLTGPVTTYSNLGNTSCANDVTLTATITDASGVNIASLSRPRLYFKKSTNANTFVDNTSATDGWKFVEATGAGGSPFSFTTNFALLFGGAPILADQIQYFVVAQDNAATPNISINSGTFAATPTSVALTSAAFPLTGTINSYTLVAGGLSGTSVTVGAAGTYTSLTGATGLFNAINTLGMSGPLTVNIIDLSVAETGAIALNQINYNGCAAGPYPLVIKPSAVTGSTLTGALASNGLIRLNGADSVTIDGSFNGSSSRNLTITNTSTTSPTAVLLSSLGAGAGATGNTIKNTNISTGVSGATGYGISVGTTPGVSGADNDTTRIQNNNISVATIGVYAAGTAPVSSGGNDGLEVSGNTIDYNGTIASIGIQVGNSVNSNVSGNTVSEQTTTTQAPTAISLETGFVLSSVTNNVITKSLTTNTGGYGGRGITIGTGTAASGLTLSNNVIYGVNGSDFSGFSNSSSMGIAIGMIGNSSLITTTAGGINLYHNSVRMTGNIGSNSTSAKTAALYLGTGASALDIRNNVFANTQTGNNASQKNYAVYSDALIGAFTTMNNNDYYVLNSFNAASAIPGFIGSDRTTIGTFQTGFGGNLNSTLGDPRFNSDTDLRPQLGSPVSALLGAGGTATGVTTDILGVIRSVTTPTIGAYENAVDVAPPVITYGTLGNTTDTMNRAFGSVTITDASGVNGTLGTRPRVYYKKSTDANAFVGNTSADNGWKFVEANGSTSPFDFTINYALLTSAVATNDVIQYFVVAQDNAGTPNVAINSGTFALAPTSVALAAAQFPIGGTINQYRIAALIPTSTLYVGTGSTCGVSGTDPCTYTSLTNANGVFDFINNNVVGGNITIELANNLTGETGSVALNAFASPYTVKIYPTNGATPAAPRTVTGTGSGGVLIKLNGADRVTIDGSLGGVGTDRSLTLSNTNTANGTGTISVASLGTGAGATNNTIKNCVIKAGNIGTTTNFTFGIIVNDTTGAAAGADNDDLTIQNNQIMQARTGIQIVGVAATGINDNVSVTGNLIGDNTVANSIGRIGLVVSVANNATITGNTVKNLLLSADSSSATGVSLATITGTSSVSNNSITGITNSASSLAPGALTMSGSTGVTVASNVISAVSGTGSSDTPYGISIGSSSGITLTGNNISSITANASSGVPFGISLATFTGSTVSQNTIDTITNSSSGDPFGISVGTGVTTSTFSRNAISNITYTGTGGYGGRGIGINTGNAASSLTFSNNMIWNIKGDSWNDFTSDSIAGIRILGTTGGLNFYNNSVYLGSGSFAGSTSGTLSAAMYVGATATALDIRNNIFATNLVNSNAAAAKSYAIYSAAPASAFTSINNNDYFATGTQGVLGFLGADITAIGDWRTATVTPNDLQSISANPQFASATDLHITHAPANPSLVENAGTPIGSVLTDFDGDARDAATPDIGADEVTSFQYAPATYSIAENGAGSVTVTVTRTSAVNAGSVMYATANGTATGGASCSGYPVDYVSASGTLSYLAGETSKTFTVTICNDAVFEGDETINLSLSTPTGSLMGSPSTGTITITNDEATPALSVNDVEFVAQSVVGTQFTVTQSGVSSFDTTVDYDTNDITATRGATCSGSADYQRAMGTLTILAGATSGTVSVNICPDTVQEPTETFSIDLTNATNATISDNQGIGTISSDDNSSASIGTPAAQFEGDSGTTTMSFPVTLTLPVSTATTINYTVTPGSATTPSDYTSSGSSIIIPANSTAPVNIDVAINGDTTFEGDETFTVTISPVGVGTGTAMATGTILNDECVTPPSGMVAWYDGSGSSPVVNDIGGTNNGAFVGGAAFATGKVGQGLTFDGINSFVSVPDDSRLVPASAITVDAWVKTTDSSGFHGLVSKFKHFTGSSDDSYNLSVENGGIRWQVVTTANSTGYFQTAGAVADGQWHHVVGTFDSVAGEQKLYIDGVLQFNLSVAGTISPGTGTALQIGASDFGGGPTAFLNGQVDEVEIFNRALTSGEIADLAKASGAGKCHTSTLQLSSATGSVAEAGTSMFTVTRDGANDSAVDVTYATADGTATGSADATCDVLEDFIRKSGLLSFAAGQSSNTISVNTCSDLLYEGNEDFSLTLSTPITGPATVGTPPTETMTITDDAVQPSVQFSANRFTGTEGGVITVTAQRDGATGNDVTVTATTGAGGSADCSPPGTDYVAFNGPIHFAPGVTSVNFDITVCTDNLYEGTDTFDIYLYTLPMGGATIGAQNFAFLDIINIDAVPTFNLSSAAASVGENDGFATVTINRGGASANVVSVNYDTAPGTANSGSGCSGDFDSVSGNHLFSAGETTFSFNVPVCNDAIYEAAETFTVALSSPSTPAVLGATILETVTITNDDAAPTISVNDYTFSGQSGIADGFTVSLSGNATALPVTVNYQSNNVSATGGGSCTGYPVDYQSVSGMLTFNPGTTSLPVEVTICPDTVQEPTETFTLDLSSPVGASFGDSQGIGTIESDDNSSASIGSPTAQNEGNSLTTTMTFPVTLTLPVSTATTINYTVTPGSATTPSDYTSSGSSISIAAGDTTGNIVVTINGDTTYEADESFTVTITPVGVGTGTAMATGTILNDDAPPGTLVVTNTTDNDGVCLPLDCSLRQAINSANANADTSTINFAIPGAGVKTISPGAGGLPGIAYKVIIDGYSQSGASENTSPLADNAVILIRIDGASAGTTSGFRLASTGSTVQGFSITGFGEAGIAGSGGGNIVRGNFVGVLPDGTTAAGNVINGVYMDGPNNVLGGTAAGDRNLISRNGVPVGAGIALVGAATGNQVLGNLIGTDATGLLVRGNTGPGVSIGGGASGNLIGGTIAGSRNVISGNGAGIGIQDNGSVNNVIKGNYIGTTVDGVTALGNTSSGIFIEVGPSLSGNVIGGILAGEGNVIANSGNDGVAINTAGNTKNTIRGNSIYNSANLLGIALGGDGVTLNDPNDTDSGPNNFQNFPVLAQATVTGSTKTIKGTLNTTPSSAAGYAIDFYSNPSCSSTGYGEGKTYIGSITTSTTNGSGNVTPFTFNPTSLTIGQLITATATDSLGNTSEFSQCKTVVAGSAGNIEFSSATFAGSEGTATAAITIKRTGGSDGSVSATFSTSNGTAVAPGDYTAIGSQTVTFADGDTTDKTINISIADDNLYEGTETVNLSLTTTTVNVLQLSATLNIADNDAQPVLAFSTASYVGAEGTTANIIVTRTGALGNAVTVGYSTGGGSATAGVCGSGGDYVATSGTISLAANQTSDSFAVVLCTDVITESNETVGLSLASPTGGATLGLSTATLTITDPVVIGQGYEADVAGGTGPPIVFPDTGFGYGDGMVSNLDITRMRRLVSGASTVNPAINEFQRADCAPYIPSGDGRLTSGDVTVARRYANGSLIIKAASGPITPAMFAPLFEQYDDLGNQIDNAIRQTSITIAGAKAARGQNVTVAVELDQRGTENAYSYTIHFDPRRLTMQTGGVVVSVGSAVNGGSLTVNYVDVANGNIGVLFDMPSGQVITPAEAKHTLLMTFYVPVSAAPGETPITFTSDLAEQYLSDMNGDPLFAKFTAGAVKIAGRPDAANATLGGRITTASGLGVKGAVVVLSSNHLPEPKFVRTSSLGYFSFDNLDTGESYVVTVNSKRYTFASSSRLVNLTDSVDDIDFVAEP